MCPALRRPRDVPRADVSVAARHQQVMLGSLPTGTRQVKLGSLPTGTRQNRRSGNGAGMNVGRPQSRQRPHPGQGPWGAGVVFTQAVIT